MQLYIEKGVFLIDLQTVTHPAASSKLAHTSGIIYAYMTVCIHQYVCLRVKARGKRS